MQPHPIARVKSRGSFGAGSLASRANKALTNEDTAEECHDDVTVLLGACEALVRASPDALEWQKKRLKKFKS